MLYHVDQSIIFCKNQTILMRSFDWCRNKNRLHMSFSCLYCIFVLFIERERERERKRGKELGKIKTTMFWIRWMNINWLQAQRKPQEQPFLYEKRKLYFRAKICTHEWSFILNIKSFSFFILCLRLEMSYCSICFCFTFFVKKHSRNKLDNLFFHYANLMYSRALATRKT